MTKQELLAKLNSSEELMKMAFIPVSEVIKLVEALEEETVTIDNDLIDQIVDEICNSELDLIEDYTLGMSYREVELEGVDINDNEVRRAVERAIKDR